MNLQILKTVFQKNGINFDLIGDTNIRYDGMIITISDNAIYGRDTSGNVFSQSYLNDDIFAFLNAWQTLQVVGTFKQPYINTTIIKIEYLEELERQHLTEI